MQLGAQCLIYEICGFQQTGNAIIDNQMNNRYIEEIKVMKMIFFFSVAIAQLLLVSAQECCLQLSRDRTRCLTCPETMRYFKGNCLFRVMNCLSYSGVECSECESPYVPSLDGHCQVSSNPYKDSDVLITNNRVIILADQARLLYPIVKDASITKAFDRTYLNQTVHTFVEFITSDQKKFQASTQFQDGNLFIMSFLRFREIKTQQPAITTVSDEIQMRKNFFHRKSARSIYRYLPTQERTHDQGFLKIDELIKEVHQKQLGNNPDLLAAYSRRSTIYSIQYKIYYKSSAPRKMAYQVIAVYSIISDKVFVLSFTRTSKMISTLQ